MADPSRNGSWTARNAAIWTDTPPGTGESVARAPQWGGCCSNQAQEKPANQTLSRKPLTSPTELRVRLNEFTVTGLSSSRRRRRAGGSVGASTVEPARRRATDPCMLTTHHLRQVPGATASNLPDAELLRPTRCMRPSSRHSPLVQCVPGAGPRHERVQDAGPRRPAGVEGGDLPGKGERAPTRSCEGRPLTIGACTPTGAGQTCPGKLLRPDQHLPIFRGETRPLMPRPLLQSLRWRQFGS